MIPNRFLITLLMMSAACLAAQPINIDSEFDNFNHQISRKFEQFNQAAEAEFEANFIAQWQSFTSASATPYPAQPKPEQQPVALVKPSIKTSKPINNAVLMNSKNADSKTFAGHSLLQLPLENLTFLRGTEPPDFLAFRRQALNNPAFTELIDFTKFMQARTSSKPYTSVVLAKRICALHYTEQSQIACAWLLGQTLGIDVRIGLRNTTLILLVKSEQQWYETPYFDVKADRLYVINLVDYKAAAGPTYLQTSKHEQAQQLSDIQLSQEINPALKNMVTREKFTTTFTLDLDHVAYIHQLPKLEVSAYLHDTPPLYIEKQLLTWLKSVEGKPLKRFEKILATLQALPYQLDDEQFGMEKPLTISQLIFYPFSDCEDRVYALAAMNRLSSQHELAALYYPNHLSAAIKLADAWQEADPTYEGATIGMRQPAYRNDVPEYIF